MVFEYEIHIFLFHSLTIIIIDNYILPNKKIIIHRLMVKKVISFCCSHNLKQNETL